MLEPKFKIDQKVFYLSQAGILSGTINSYTVTRDKITYMLDGNISFFHQYELFESKELLIQSL